MSTFSSIEYLSVLFFIVAALYSMVGFGGGSSYIAILTLVGISHTVTPIVALCCNIVVVLGSLIKFYKYEFFNLKELFPFLILSIPMTFIGGSLVVDQKTYQIILAVCLFLASMKIFIVKKHETPSRKFFSKKMLILIGGAIGFLSGMVGIGGGVFLAPILYTLNWGNSKKIAATASGFIFVNSIAGLLGQLQKDSASIDFIAFLPLVLAVSLGGQVGSWLTTRKLSFRIVELFTAFLISFVSVRLLITNLA